jgi:spermidine synthase
MPATREKIPVSVTCLWREHSERCPQGSVLTAVPESGFFPVVKILFHCIFLLSGASALCYQMIWTRMFSFGLGHEMPAMLAIVTAYFAGFSIGAWFLDKKISQSMKPAVWYSVLESIIAAWAIVSIIILPHVNILILFLTGPAPAPMCQWSAAFFIPLCVLAPSTVPMGATFTAIDRAVGRLSARGTVIGGLYGSNTLGAVLGVVAGAFFVIPAFGFSVSLLLCAGISLISAGCAAILSRSLPAQFPATVTIVSKQDIAPPENLQRSSLYFTLFMTGVLGIAYESLVIRGLSQVFYNTVYTYAITLSVYLTGSSIGGFLFQKFLSHCRDSRLHPNALFICQSILCCAGAFFLSMAR